MSQRDEEGKLVFHEEIIKKKEKKIQLKGNISLPYPVRETSPTFAIDKDLLSKIRNMEHG